MVVLDIALYLAAIVAANATAATLISLPLGLTTTIGTLLFGATFTLRDRLHRRVGRRGVYLAIGAACCITALVCAITGSGWRILAASIVGLAASETADTEVYARTVGSWLKRVAASNAVSVPLDTLVFNLLAFGGVWGWVLLLSVAAGDILVKYVIGGLVALWRPRTQREETTR